MSYSIASRLCILDRTNGTCYLIPTYGRAWASLGHPLMAETREVDPIPYADIIDGPDQL